jgi:hypothetical protein
LGWTDGLALMLPRTIFFYRFNFVHTHWPMQYWFLDKLVSFSTSSRLLKKMGRSWKVLTRFQLNKYSTFNMIRYLYYLDAIQQFPLEILKFANESHLVAKDLTKWKVLGLKAQRVYLKEQTLHEP